MTELERLLIEQLSKLSEQHELQFKQLSDVQLQQSRLIEGLSQRLEKLTQLLQE